MLISELRDSFLKDKTLSGCSENTIHDYYFFIKVFMDYLGTDLPVSSISREMIDSYVLSIRDRGLSKATQHTYLHHLRIFFNYCVRQETLLFSPADIPVPRSPKKRLRIYSTADIRLIYQSISGSSDWITARNRAIVFLMLDSGLRQMEITTLRLKDIDFNEERMIVHGKGNKERVVPLGSSSAAFIKQYLELLPHKQSKFLFCSNSGEKLSGNAIKLFMRRLALQLPFEFSSHKLRHNFATNYCLDQLEENGFVDTYSLMYIMGHEEIETTEKYVHFAKEILASKKHISHLDKIFQSITA